MHQTMPVNTNNSYQQLYPLNNSGGSNKIPASNRRSLAHPLVPKLNFAKMMTLRGAIGTLQDPEKKLEVAQNAAGHQAKDHQPNPVSSYSLDQPQSESSQSMPKPRTGAAQTSVSIDSRQGAECYYQTTSTSRVAHHHQNGKQSFVT